MKKNFMIALVALATISFSACNSKSEGADKSDKDSVQVETSTETISIETTPAEGSNTNLDKYAALVEKMIPLQEKAEKGDAAAIQELNSLSQEVANIVTELQNEMATMTPEQAERFNDIAKKVAGQVAQQ